MCRDKQQEQNSDRQIDPQYYRALVDCVGVAIIDTDLSGRIVSCNRAAAEIFAPDSPAVLGPNIADAFPGPSRPLLQKAIKEVAAGRIPAQFEIDLPLTGRSPVTLAVIITAIRDQHDRTLGLALCLHDISRRKALREQLTVAEKTASLGTLASGVAHHFNNIIGGVATFVDFALNSANPQTTRRALQMTAEAANRISHITESLLTFAAKDTRQFDLSDLTEVVLTFSHLVEAPLAEKNIELRIDLQPVPIFEVAGSRMHQVLGNLLDNAELAMPDGGAVTIELKREGADLLLRFTDTGQGVDPKDIPRVFEPFFTTHGVEAGGDRSNIGLGLSVVQGIVQEYGGAIEVQSRLGAGTTFIMHFPIDRSKKDD